MCQKKWKLNEVWLLGWQVIIVLEIGVEGKQDGSAGKVLAE